MSENLKVIGSQDNYSDIKGGLETKAEPEKPISILKLPERAAPETEPGSGGTMNAIINGSKLTGNMTITRDLEVTGDYEGDIVSGENSNIFIKGTCKGNIRTKGGSVEIEGSMTGGDIVAGGYVKVTGKFHGGKIQACSKIHINGEFSGTLESAEIEVGASAQGTGELVYRGCLSIEKGAKVEGRIIRMETEQKNSQEPEAKAKKKKGIFSKE